MDLRLESENGDPCGWKENKQNNFNDALYKYGWKSMLNWEYGEKGKKKLLNHCKQFTGHYNHLHIQGFAPTINEIK